MLVFDEIEKAHSDIYNILLQIMDEGVLTDSHSKKINFKNSIIILTSNISAANFKKMQNIGFCQDTNSNENNNKLTELELKKIFKPEFLSRIDETIIFKKLSSKNLRKIIIKNLEELKKRLKKLNYSFSYSQSVADHILNLNKNHNKGARAIKNLITKNVENLISDKILNKTITKKTKFKLIEKNNNLIIEKI